MKYPCLKFSQRVEAAAPAFCLFEAPVREILAWATIPRLSPKNKEGIQRAKSDYKVRGIKSFLAADDRNTIPTAVVITLADNAFALTPIGNGSGNFHEIEIFQNVGEAAFVVDGQHRLYGLNEFSPDAKVPIVAILGASDEEKAFQFIVINNKVSKVPPNHIRALTLNFTDAAKSLGLESRLNAARLSLNKNLGYVGLANTSEDSPFKGILALPDNVPENHFVVPASIESSVAYIQSKNMFESSTEEAPYEFFITIWSTIKSAWPDVFVKDSKLLSKVGIQCMTQYMTDNIDVISNFVDDGLDLSNAQDVTNAVNRVLQSQNQTFWLATWAITISDTRIVRDQVMDSLRKIQQNIKQNHPWNTEIPVMPFIS